MADVKYEPEKKPVRRKLHNEHGLAWIFLILIVAVVVMAIIAVIPSYKRAQRQGQTVACATALDTARRQLTADFMFDGYENGKAEAARDYIAFVMNGWDDLCPEGGSTYIVHNERTDNSELEWDVVCGLHCADSKKRTRLNADNVLDQLEEALLKQHNMGNFYPETIPFTLHHKEYLAQLVDEPTNLKRGTRTTMGMENAGIVAYYSIKNHSDFGADSRAEEGTIWYFSFADEDHCATWTADQQWTGDSYQGVS